MFGLPSQVAPWAQGLILSLVALAYILLLARIVGLRSFSKMTPVDFVATVATGSLLANAGTASTWSSFFQSIACIGALFAGQYCFSRLRRSSEIFRQVAENSPRLLMRNGVISKEGLAETRVSEADLIAKLREANVLDYSSVRAVVLETTGDISVLHGDGLEESLLKGVRAGS